MGCARRSELSIRVDHAEGSIAFSDDAQFVSATRSQHRYLLPYEKMPFNRQQQRLSALD